MVETSLSRLLKKGNVELEDALNYWTNLPSDRIYLNNKYSYWIYEHINDIIIKLLIF
jgi:hypothetical protein